MRGGENDKFMSLSNSRSSSSRGRSSAAVFLGLIALR